MGFWDFFAIKSRRQKELEQLQYNQWAFPYGPEQAQFVGDLLDQLLPEESAVSIAIFLIGKEGWQKNPQADDLQRMEDAFYAMRPHLPGRKRSRIWRYLAALEADAAAESCEDYPDVETLHSRAAALERQYR